MSPVLCIETATEVCSVSLVHQGQVLAEATGTGRQSHAAQITVIIRDCMEQAQVLASSLEAVAVSAGPGSYTGLRIGVSAAKGICYAAQKPLITIGTLEILAQAFLYSRPPSLPANALLCPMLDARRMEVYTALFDTMGNSVSAIEAKITDNSAFAQELFGHTIFFFGQGAEKCRPLITSPNAVFVDGIRPHARFMALPVQKCLQNSLFADMAYFEPLYLKDFIATTPKNKVLGRKI